jgi:hypothetical protein
MLSSDMTPAYAILPLVHGRMRLLAGLVAGGLLALSTAAEAGAALHVRDRLVWTAQDGKRASYRPEVRVWCGGWDPDVRVPSVHVWVGAKPAAHWELHAVRADVRRHPVVKLPNDFVFDRPHDALLFGTDRGNEVNSDTEESTGSIRFGRVRCGRHLRVSFRVNATLGSELSDGGTIAVRGSFLASAG